MDQFRGEIDQVPPQHSAVKVNGKRAYEHARKGKEVVLKVRKAEIFRYEVNYSNFPTLSFEIECGKGTYIRSLARDLGVALQSGAYMSSLVRTSIGPYSIDKTIDIEALKSQEDFFENAHQLGN